MKTTRKGTTNVSLRLGDPRRELLYQRLGRELRMTNQILADDIDTLTIAPSGPAPAWTTLEADHITFAFDQMPIPIKPTDVAVWLGTNAHELGHVLFSPRRSSALIYRLIGGERIHLRGIMNLYNIVEDQRQERFLLGRFAPWRTYLTAALGHHLDVTGDTAWILFAGRTWLPADVRRETRDNFAKVYGKASADEVANIIGAYQMLTDPGDTEADEAFNLLVRLHDLFGTRQPPACRKCQTLEGGEPDTSEAGEGAPATADQSEDGDPGQNDQGADQADQESDQDQDGKGKGQNGQDQDTDTGQSGQGAGQGHGAKGLKDRLRDAAADQIQNDATATDDLRNMMDALRHGPTDAGSGGRDPIGQYVPASAAARRLHREVSDALMELSDANEPSWIKRTDSGRLNVRRFALPGTDADQLFDRYAPGELESSELELVLLLDVSGSMGNDMTALAEATWAIRHAVDDLEGTATVLLWDDGPYQELATAGQRPDERMFIPADLGGTNPASALTEAFRILSGSTAHNRLMLILTDGSWNGGGMLTSHRVIGAMNDAGITTACGLLGLDRHTTHECQHAARIDQPAGLARLFRTVAAGQLARTH